MTQESAGKLADAITTERLDLTKNLRDLVLETMEIPAPQRVRKSVAATLTEDLLLRHSTNCIGLSRGKRSNLQSVASRALTEDFGLKQSQTMDVQQMLGKYMGTAMATDEGKKAGGGMELVRKNRLLLEHVMVCEMRG